MSQVTEREWLTKDHLAVLLAVVRVKASDRKLRLIGCACCRRVWNQLRSKRSRTAIEVAERYSDGGCERKELIRAGKSANDALQAGSEASFRYAARCVALSEAYYAAASTIGALIRGAGKDGELRGEMISILRHIIGNPFKPYPVPATWPSTVVQLAASLYDGQDCRLPLSDALEESGHSELAEHFRKEEWHPKGCWVLDVILGRT